VTLYLGGYNQTGSLEISQTDHFSQKAAEAWAPVRTDATDVDSWDFKRITSFSSRLNREIKKRSVAKLGGIGILPGAQKLRESGVTLWR